MPRQILKAPKGPSAARYSLRPRRTIAPSVVTKPKARPQAHPKASVVTDQAESDKTMMTEELTVELSPCDSPISPPSPICTAAAEAPMIVRPPPALPMTVGPPIDLQRPRIRVQILQGSTPRHMDTFADELWVSFLKQLNMRLGIRGLFRLHLVTKSGPNEEIKYVNLTTDWEEASKLDFRGVMPTVSSMGLVDGSSLIVTMMLRGGKPVVYFYTPEGRIYDRVQVRLTLNDELWRFDEMVPEPVLPQPNEAHWTGRVANNTFDHYPYLFWDALAHNVEFFWDLFTKRPATFVLDASRENDMLVQIQIDLLQEYYALSLKEATDLVTHWLPTMRKCQPHCRMVILDSTHDSDLFADMAALDIRPAPAAVHRIFVLFDQSEEAICCEPPHPPITLDRNQDGMVVVEWGGMHMERLVDPEGCT